MPSCFGQQFLVVTGTFLAGMMRTDLCCIVVGIAAELVTVGEACSVLRNIVAVGDSLVGKSENSLNLIVGTKVAARMTIVVIAIAKKVN